jgi:RNA polymerase sigma-54 factor
MTQQTHLVYQKHTHKPLTTAHLAQTMSLLEMNNQELVEKIEGELANNPALDLEEGQQCPTCNRKLYKNSPCPLCSFSSSVNIDTPIVFVSPRNDFYSRSYANTEEIPTEELSPEVETLPTYILGQIGSELAANERPIAAHILTSLDVDGLLRTPLLEIAQYHHVPISSVNKILSVIQKSDPLGAGARDPQEALLIQLEAISETQSVNPLIYRAISEGFVELSQQQYKALAKLLNTSVNKIVTISKFISENLNPYPARSHWGSVRHHTDSKPHRYHQPDVYITCFGSEDEPQLIVEIVWPIQGTLRINPAFQKALSQAPPEKTEQWNSDYQKAHLLIKCLGQRNHTLVKMMQKLAIKQRDFILKGNASSKPITRARLAEELHVHESTISRSVSGKSVQLPSGQIIPISLFFDRSLHIRTALKEIIANESKPLSDAVIAELLSERGYNIARRTVAKYRSMEGILPGHLRNSNNSE